MGREVLTENPLQQGPREELPPPKVDVIQKARKIFPSCKKKKNRRLPRGNGGAVNIELKERKQKFSGERGGGGRTEGGFRLRGDGRKN